MGRKVYRSREQARADVFDYIERFYNPTPRHSTPGYVSSVQFEEMKLTWSVSTEPAAAQVARHAKEEVRGFSTVYDEPGDGDEFSLPGKITIALQ